MPLKLDPLTVQKRSGLYCRVLLDIDCSVGLPDRLLVQRKASGVEFYVNITYERPPQFCNYCNTIGHSMAVCRKRTDFQQSSRPQQRGRTGEIHRQTTSRTVGREREDRESIRGEVAENLAINTILENAYREEIREEEERRSRRWADLVEEDEQVRDHEENVNLDENQIQPSVEVSDEEGTQEDIPSTPAGSLGTVVRETQIESNRGNMHGGLVLAEKNSSEKGQNSSAFSPVVDEDGFELALTKSQRKRMKEKQRKARKAQQTQEASPPKTRARGKGKNHT